MTDDRLPRRDWLLLPLVGLLTICIMVFGFRELAGQMFPAAPATKDSCLVIDDRSTGTRAIPNTVCISSGYETGATEYRYNSCGHRAGMECGPKPKGTFRIVMIGSSYNFGMWVARDQTFAALLPGALSRATGRRVEVYNESMLGGWPRSAALRLQEVFAAQPDLVLWVLSPRDVRNSSKVLLTDLNASAKSAATAPVAIRGAGLLVRIRYRIQATFAATGVADALATIGSRFLDSSINSLMKTQSGILLQHVVYSSRAQYIKSYLMAPELDDDTADPGYLRATLSVKWSGYLEQFDTYAADIEQRVGAAGIPLVAVMVPERAQAALISMGAWPEGIDPYSVDNEVRSIVTRHGGTYVDILPDFSRIPNPERSYFPVDGHPDANGHALIARLLAKELTTGAIPALAAAGK